VSSRLAEPDPDGSEPALPPREQEAALAELGGNKLPAPRAWR